VSILFMIVNELQGSKKKMEVENDLHSTMAPPKGIEPVPFDIILQLNYYF